MGSENQSVRVQTDPRFGRQHDGFNSHRLSTNQGKVDNLQGTNNTPSESERFQARHSASKVE
ncbi:hypothetical protein FRX31_016217, partial [Thalictrum thalictroides]